MVKFPKVVKQILHACLHMHYGYILYIRVFVLCVCVHVSVCVWVDTFQYDTFLTLDIHSHHKFWLTRNNGIFDGANRELVGLFLDKPQHLLG